MKTWKGFCIPALLLNDINAPDKNIYGIVIATLVMATRILKNSSIASPPNPTNKIIIITTIAWISIAFTGIPFFIFATESGNNPLGVPAINCLSEIASVAPKVTPNW